MSDDAEPLGVRRTISGLWGAQPPAQLRPIFALRCGIRDDAAIAETHKDKCRKLAQTSSTLIELLVFKIYSDEQFRKSEVGVPPYIRKFGHQSVLEKIGSNVMRNAHSQFDILMGICQAHILSFGASGDTESVASSLYAESANAESAPLLSGQAAVPRVKAVYKQETAEDTSSPDLTSLASAAAADDEQPIFDDELELSEFLQRRSMEWMPADGDVGTRRQSESGVNAALENPDAIAALVQGDALNVIDCDLFYITIPDHESFQRIRRLDLKGNNLSDCPVLSSMPQLEVLVLDNNFLTSHSTFHTAPLLHTLWLNHNVVANLAPLAVAFTLSFPKLSYLSMMFNPCHPSSLPGATEQSFRQYRLLIVTLLPRIEAIDAVRVDPDEKSAVQDQLKGQPRLSSVNVVDALNIEKLQPYLNPQKLPLPYSGTSVLEGTVTIQSGKLFAFSSQQVYFRLSISQSSSSALCDLPMLSWVPYSASTCASCAEVERASLPPDVFETNCTSVILLPGFTIGPTKNPRSGFKRSVRIDWPAADDAAFPSLTSGKIPGIPSYDHGAQQSEKLVIGFNSVTAMNLWMSAVQWAVDAKETIQKYETAIQAMRVAQYLTDRSSAHNQPDGGAASLEFSQESDFTAEHSFSVDEPEPLESWSLRARVHAFRELFDQGSHGVAGCFATDTLVCASLQGSTPDKLLAMHDWLLGLFNKNYLIIDVTTADEGLMNVAVVLQWHVQKLPIALSEPPSFAAMWEFCDLVNNHMQRHPRSGVLLVSANSRNRAGLLVGAYLLSQGACPTAIDALSLWSVLRSESHIKSRTISKGVSNKTYQLYLSYFGHFFSSGKDARAAQMPNNALFAIGRVLISHMFINPTTSSDSLSQPTYDLHVFMNGQPFRLATADYDSQQSRGSLAFDFSAAGNVDFGPVRFELRRSGCEQSIFSFAFHSGFVVTNNIILKLTDVDRGEGAAAEGLAFSTRVSIDLIH